MLHLTKFANFVFTSCINLDFDPPPGPAVYRKGWKDGCITGYGAYTDRFYSGTNAYGWRQDPKLKDDPMYYRVWKDAFFYCTFYADKYRGLKI